MVAKGRVSLNITSTLSSGKAATGLITDLQQDKESSTALTLYKTIKYYNKKQSTQKMQSPGLRIKPWTSSLPGRHANLYTTQEIPTLWVQIALITLLVTYVEKLQFHGCFCLKCLVKVDREDQESGCTFCAA